MSATAGGLILCGQTNLASAQQTYSGPYWLFVEAAGGWDPSSFCDPKGFGLGANGDINNYDQNDIGEAGNIRYAPPPESFANDTALYRNQDFFQSHYQRLLVINGIDYGTNSHSVGRTASWTGSRTKNYPSLGALIAYEHASELAMPMVANRISESSKTNGLVPGTIVSGSDLNAIREIAFPNRANVNQPNQYYSDNIRAMIDSASGSRRLRQIEGHRLQRVREALVRHDIARNRDVSSLQNFVNKLDSVSAPNAYVNSRNNARKLYDQAQIAFSAFESGSTACAQIQLGGFDTHSNHDAKHYPLLMDYLAAVDNIIEDAMTRGIGDNLIIVMGSDFARTNKYNATNGKDHWSHTSMMVWGAESHFQGNRVVGATDDLQVSMKIDPVTLSVDVNGIKISPEHLHQAIRSLADLDASSKVSQAFPFAEQVLPIFT
jgi:uncharacterized protein (DUF1501 family)